MRKFMTLCAVLGAFSALAPAASTWWNGTLLNYDCFEHSKSVHGCGAKPTTDRFMLYNNGKQIRFDDATNDRTRMAMQARADKASNPFHTKRDPVYAKATGSFHKDGKFDASTITVK
jgi:hypothetical protein